MESVGLSTSHPAACISLAMEQAATLAFGIDLHFVATIEGGRHTALLGGCDRENRFTYRPNWGLPGWAEGDQTAGPVLGFSRIHIEPGEEARAVVVALFPDRAPGWRK